MIPAAALPAAERARALAIELATLDALEQHLLRRMATRAAAPWWLARVSAEERAAALEAVGIVLGDQ